ncbi:MAG TPA: fibronectin type III domain-containing protein [Solirubrobacteraceae bacterium]|nr:fibronectin type III domain-containing protein [Solirubrobacteraceae bacterium]
MEVRAIKATLAVAGASLVVFASALAPSAAQAQRDGAINLRLTPGSGTIASSWDVSSTTGLSGFRVRWKKVGGGDNGRIELPRTARSYTITHLRHVAYEVIVRALYKEKGGGAASGEATPQQSLEEPPEEETPGEEPPEEEEVEEPEEPPVEEAPKETGKVAVSATPTGPPTPAGGWSVAYADGFGAPIGNGPGQDNTWYPNNCTVPTNCKGFNTDEMEVMNPSAASVTPEGLKLTCTYTAAAQQPGEKHYVCGTLRGQTASGYRPFTWSPGKGQTLVFQAVAKFPPNTDEADPGWWTNGPPWNDTEVDFFEGGGASPDHSTGWKTDWMYTAWFANPHPIANKRNFATDPSLAFHTYTFEILPNNTYSVWIDGVLQSWATNVGPAKPDVAEKATLILSYALRECRSSGCKTGFTSGTREFDVKSVSVYEDKAHQGVGVENAGLAPGTKLG